MATHKKPTYGELIDLFNKCPDNNEYREQYPKIYIGRPRRFYETVKRIVAPTQPSLRGGSKISGSSLSTYRKRIWEPRIRNPIAAG